MSVKYIICRKLDGKITLCRRRPGREDNIKTGVQEVGGDLDWFHLGQDRDKWLVDLGGRIILKQACKK